MFCKHCGKPIPADSKFCPECGGDIIGKEPQEEPSATPSPEAIPEPTPQATIPMAPAQAPAPVTPPPDQVVSTPPAMAPVTPQGPVTYPPQAAVPYYPPPDQVLPGPPPTAPPPGMAPPIVQPVQKEKPPSSGKKMVGIAIVAVVIVVVVLIVLMDVLPGLIPNDDDDLPEVDLIIMTSGIEGSYINGILVADVTLDVPVQNVGSANVNYLWLEFSVDLYVNNEWQDSVDAFPWQDAVMVSTGNFLTARLEFISIIIYTGDIIRFDITIYFSDAWEDSYTRQTNAS